MLNWIKRMVCRFSGHRWISAYGPEWACAVCKARISSVTQMAARDRFHIGTGVGDG